MTRGPWTATSDMIKVEETGQPAKLRSIFTCKNSNACNFLGKGAALFFVSSSGLLLESRCFEIIRIVLEDQKTICFVIEQVWVFFFVFNPSISLGLSIYQYIYVEKH